MAVKTFGSEILTSADTNTYLANSGLVYVTSATVGTGVSSVTVTGCFSSTYDNYKIIYSGGVGSVNGNLGLRLGSTTTNYYGVCIYGPWTASSISNLNTNNGANMTIMGGYDAAFAALTAELINPYQAKQTIGNAFIIDSNNQGTSVYRLNNNTSYTDFTLLPTSGTITGGTITVYGYRKA